MALTTTVFMNGGSQAVRIPKSFRFDTSEVTIRRFMGGVLLQPVARPATLAELLAKCDDLPEEDKAFLDDRPCNVAPEDRGLFK